MCGPSSSSATVAAPSRSPPERSSRTRRSSVTSVPAPGRRRRTAGPATSSARASSGWPASASLHSSSNLPRACCASATRPSRSERLGLHHQRAGVRPAPPHRGGDEERAEPAESLHRLGVGARLRAARSATMKAGARPKSTSYGRRPRDLPEAPKPLLALAALPEEHRLEVRCRGDPLRRCGSEARRVLQPSPATRAAARAPPPPPGRAPGAPPPRRAAPSSRRPRPGTGCACPGPARPARPGPRSRAMASSRAPPGGAPPLVGVDGRERQVPEGPGRAPRPGQRCRGPARTSSYWPAMMAT